MTIVRGHHGVMAVPTGEAFTVDDLERMPDDGHRYELLDGVLVVSPAEWVAQRPFPVTVRPADLVSGLRR